MQQRIAELKEITARPKFKEAMKPTSSLQPLHDSDDIADEEWYWEEVGYDLDVREVLKFLAPPTRACAAMKNTTKR